MKNSKVLSLLTAAALVVSSFSGLALDGGEAKAAGIITGITANFLTAYPAQTTIEAFSATDNAAVGGATRGTIGAGVASFGITQDINTAPAAWVAPAAAATQTVSGLKVLFADATNFDLQSVPAGNAGDYWVVLSTAAPGAATASYADDTITKAFKVTVRKNKYGFAPTAGQTQNVGASADAMYNEAGAGTYDVVNKNSLTGSVSLITVGTNYGNIRNMPTFESLFTAGVTIVPAGGPTTDAASIVFTKGSVNDIGQGRELLTWTYEVKVANAANAGTLTFTYTTPGASVLDGCNFTYVLTFAATLSPATYGSFTNIAFLDGATVSGAPVSELSWPVTGVNLYTTVMETRVLTIANLKANNIASRFDAASYAGRFTDSYAAVRNGTKTWFVETESSDTNVVRVSAEDNGTVTLLAYGLGSAVVSASITDIDGHTYRTSATVTVVPGDAYIRLYNSVGRDVTSITLNGDSATETLAADVRSASYQWSGDVNYVLVNEQNVATETSSEIVKRYVVPAVDGNKITLTAVGNATAYLYVYTTVTNTYNNYFKGSYIADSKPLQKQIDTLNRMMMDGRPEVRRIPVYTTGVTAAIHTDYDSSELKIRAEGAKATVDAWVNQQGVGASNTTSSTTSAKFSAKSSDEKIVTVTVNTNGQIVVTPVATGVATVKIDAEYYVGSKKTTPATYELKVDVNTKDSGEEPTPEHKAGEPVAEDGVTGYLNEDLETVTVTDATVVSKAITIPATIQGFKVVAIDPQAFKGTSAKTVYVVGSVDTIGKGAFKGSKVKKVYFYDPAALQTVGKNAFKKTNAKVVGIDGSFSDAAAKALKSAGAKTVKNNGAAK